jgi:NAD(P)H-flavin reductase
MFKLIESHPLVPNMHWTTVEAPEVARSIQPGQFVIIRAEEGGERIPLTAADWNRELGTISIAFMVIGHTTHLLSTLKVGTEIPTVVGPLGNQIEIDQFGTVLLVGGCYGVGTIYPIARALKEKGNRVVCVVEARSAHLFYREEKLREVADQVIYITRDGTRGFRGHVAKNLPAIIESLEWRPDQIIVNGCNFLMKRSCDASRSLNIKTLVCLNTIMIDGTGMCGVCRVTVADKMKFACVDGPYFDGHQVNWDELAQRRQMYLREETASVRSSEAEDIPERGK